MNNSQHQAIERAKKIHMVGIKGVGMTALAQILRSKGKDIEGSDTSEQFFTDEILQKEEIPIHEGFSKNNIHKETDLVITSLAYDHEHEENAHAKAEGIVVVQYQEVLAWLSASTPTIAITGSHGKTTTTAIAGVLHAAVGSDPTVLVGSMVHEFQGNARTGKGDLFIVEADEYGKKVLDLTYQTLVVTNIDYDHPDHFTKEEYTQLFLDAASRVPDSGTLVLNQDNSQSAPLRAKYKDARTLSIQSENGTLVAEKIKEKHGNMHCTILWDGEDMLCVETSLIGTHNIANILAAVATLTKEQCATYRQELEIAIKDFKGTKRRFELMGNTSKGALVVDDYAHHPTEIKETLQAARTRYSDKKIWCIFHAHTYSRTEALLKEFASSFCNADTVILPPIYSSARETVRNVSAQDLQQAIQKNHKDVLLFETFEEITHHINEHAEENDLVITMGAGDVWQVAKQLTQ